MQTNNIFRNKNYNDPYMQEAIIIINDRTMERKKKRPKKDITNREFLLKRRTLSDFLPAGNEDISLIIIFTIVPYSTGMIFVFFVIAEASFTKIISLAKYHSFPLIWAIGYEIVALVLLLWLGKIVFYSLFEGKDEKPSKEKRKKR